MPYENVKYDVAGGVARIALARPDSLNSLTDPMKAELLAALGAAEADGAVRAVLLTGEGRGFCAGEALNPDLVKQAEPDLGATLRTYYNPIVAKLRAIEKPVVAAVNGIAAGAGVSLAVAADLRIASDKASFVLAFVKIGLVPDAGGTYLLPRLVGFGKAVEMAMTGDKVDAAEAERIGLVNRVVPAAELEAEAGKLAARLAASPTRAIGLMKRAFAASLSSALAEQLELEASLQTAAAATADFHEGVSAFLEKRAAKFTGR